MKQLLLALLALLFVTASAIGQTTYYVSTDGDNANDGLSPTEAFRTIQHAVDVVDEDDIIQVAAGTYTETITITKSITIEGDIDGDARPVIQPEDQPAKLNNEDKSGFPAIISVSTLSGKTEKSTEASISGIEIDGKHNEHYQYGIYVWEAHINIDDVIIRNIRSQWKASGIWIENETAHITNCKISNIETQDSFVEKSFNAAYGIYVAAPDQTDFNSGFKDQHDFQITIADNSIHSIWGDSRASGIYVDNSFDAEISENTIENVEAQHAAVGVYIRKAAAYDKINDDAAFHIRKNNIVNIKSTSTTYFPVLKGVLFPMGSFGIHVIDHQNVEISDNTVEDIMSEGFPSSGIHVIASLPSKPTKQKNDKLIKVVDNQVVNVFGRQYLGLQPRVPFKANGYLPLGSVAIGVSEAGNTLIKNNELHNDLSGSDEGYDPFLGIAVNNPDGETTISENAISTMMVGIYGFHTPHIITEDNIVTNCIIGIAAADVMLPDFFSGSEKNNALQIPDMISLMEKQAREANRGGYDFTVELWEFNENTVTENEIGFWVMYEGELDLKSEDVSKFRAKGNIVQGNAGGFLIWDDGSLQPEINKNIIQDHVVISIFYMVSDGEIDNNDTKFPMADGRFNYWGEVSSPDETGLLNVRYSPWLGAEPGTTPMTYFVDDSGSIQDAIDLAKAGETVRILGGVYEGDLDTESKGIILYPGDSPACVTIEGDFTVSNQDKLVVDIFGTANCDDEDNGYTQLTVEGDVILNGIELEIQLGFLPGELGKKFDIIFSDNPIQGTFDQGDEIQAEYQNALVTFSISYYTDPDKNGDYTVTLEITDIELPAVPIGHLGLIVLAGLVVARVVFSTGKRQTPQT